MMRTSVISDLNNNLSKRRGYSLDPGIYEVTDLNKTLQNFSPDNVKLTITIDGIRSNLNTNQFLSFTENSFLTQC